MSEMVAKVAEALKAFVSGMDGCYSDKCCCSGFVAFECRTGFKMAEIARAAIEAMREPTDAMWRAAESKDDELWEDGSACAASHWNAMIDAALKPE